MQPHPSRHATRAFTLLEMGVVLTIIALIVGGILGGTQMVRQSKLKSIINDFAKTKSAVAQFKTTYGSPPGDMAEATANWGTDTGNCAVANRPIGSPKTATCDGDANDTITGVEQFRAWQHLANAGLMDGLTFSGVGNGDDVTCVAGTNCPRGKLDDSALSLFTIGTIADSAGGAYWPGTWGTVLMLGADLTNFAELQPVMTTANAYGIDTKLDDGKPATGKVFVARAITGMAAGDCVSNITQTAANALTATYVLSNEKAKTCNLGYTLD